LGSHATPAATRPPDIEATLQRKGREAGEGKGGEQADTAEAALPIFRFSASVVARFRQPADASSRLQSASCASAFGFSFRSALKVATPALADFSVTPREFQPPTYRADIIISRFGTDAAAKVERAEDSQTDEPNAAHQPRADISPIAFKRVTAALPSIADTLIITLILIEAASHALF